ncbi:hypothetical protein NUW58_g5219 [Xylaria curta]|uniref:Uncharacterized protein n=1 Tax=Xylaria curta TaxID=42375 RepID=A0ACC1P368_9PEZI|nr:hypothetical protein NUW58_g5219 [Xylaria curta]
MSDADPDPVRRLGPTDSDADAISPSFTDSNRHPRTKALSRGVAMKRDRSRDSRDGSRGRVRPEPTRRGPAPGTQTRLRSSSPGSRPSQGYRGREKKYHGGESYRDDGERRATERRRSESPDHRDRYHDSTRRGETSPVRDFYPSSGKRYDGSSSPRHHSRPSNYSEHARDRSFSPSSRKRPRSRSPLPFPPSRSKRSKRERERDRRRRADREERFERDHLKGHGLSRPDRTHSPSRRRSISPQYDASHRRYVERSAHPNNPRLRRRSRSPTRGVNLDDRIAKPPRPRGDSRTRDPSLSPRPNSRRSSFSHTHSPSRSTGRSAARGPAEVGTHSRRSSPTFEQPRVEYPRSPKDRGSRRSRKKTKYRDEPGPPLGGPLASGANSIEVNTFRRTDRRTSFEALEPSRDAGTTRLDDLSPREISPRIKPTSPHYRSSASPQPYATARPNKGGDPHYPHRRHSQWSAVADSNRDALSPPGQTIPARPETPNARDDDDNAENISQSPQDGQAEDPSKDERAVADQTSSSRPPPTAPTGPASSKFSFAFKTSTKNPVAAPKPEISQKFSAAPKKEAHTRADDRDRDLPRDTPREPASARARADYHHNRPPPPPPEPQNIPPLDPELAKSVSVYFRKPGNESVVGSGTYGKVFKGKHVYTGKLVALKRIRMEGERDGFPVTAMREIKLLQSLRHENIVELHEVMIEKNECYMVFEYLSHDLTGLLNHPTYKLDAGQKKHLAMQLFQGLDYLHKRGVLHRDIKAANILVSSDGILKLADFGLARFYAKRHQLDYTNRVITIWYRCPELLLGETRYDAAVDIWSAACVMVEIFTRHAIFPGDGGEISQLEKIWNILGTPNRREWPGLADTPWFELLRPGYRKPNVFAEKYRERLPAAAFDLLADMFRFDPTRRPSAADVLAHRYFTIEQPPPRQAVELKDIKGDWHEFESKALRRQKEKQEKQQQRDARHAAAAAAKEGGHDKERKRPPSVPSTQSESKRQHLDGQSASLNREHSSIALPLPENPTTETAPE